MGGGGTRVRARGIGSGAVNRGSDGASPSRFWRTRAVGGRRRAPTPALPRSTGRGGGTVRALVGDGDLSGLGAGDGVVDGFQEVLGVPVGLDEVAAEAAGPCLVELAAVAEGGHQDDGDVLPA